MDLKELIAKQQAIVDKAKAEGRAMSEEEERTFNELQAEIDKLKTEGAEGAATEREAERK